MIHSLGAFRWRSDNRSCFERLGCEFEQTFLNRLLLPYLSAQNRRNARSAVLTGDVSFGASEADTILAAEGQAEAVILTENGDLL